MCFSFRAGARANMQTCVVRNVSYVHDGDLYISLCLSNIYLWLSLELFLTCSLYSYDVSTSGRFDNMLALQHLCHSRTIQQLIVIYKSFSRTHIQRWIVIYADTPKTLRDSDEDEGDEDAEEEKKKTRINKTNHIWRLYLRKYLHSYSRIWRIQAKIENTNVNNSTSLAIYFRKQNCGFWFRFSSSFHRYYIYY